MNIKKLTALLCTVVMVLSLAACGGSGDKAENKHYTVGICQRRERHLRRAERRR